MFRFSCFHSPVHSQKSKKSVHLSTESMQKTLEDYPANRPHKNSDLSKEVSECVSTGWDTNPSSSSVVQDWKSEGFKSLDTESNDGARNVPQMRKSVSLGSGLVHYDRMSSGDESSSSHNDHSELGLGSASGGQVDDTEPEIRPASDSLQLSSNVVNYESVNRESDFSLECKQSEKEVSEDSENQFSEEGTCDSTPRTPQVIVKSGSLPFLRASGNLVHQSRSSEDLEALVLRRKDLSVDKSESPLKQDEERDEVEDEYEGDVDKNNAENPVDESYDAYDYVGSAKDWIVPAVDELDKGKNVEEDRSVCRWEDLPSKEFKIKRIEKWVKEQQHCSSLEETDGLMDSEHHGKTSKNDVLDGVAASRIDSKALPRVDAAKRYISSLSGSATAAQLANHGLVAIPFMSTFTSLKALNLSGNTIVRITAGTLPRGLHILNLSKNNISAIEGLRELTRLRVLDLSYNRILRIGHGLASCSSLKELYLAGNKISEVEGLHRLLKLNVLDLRFNKLSTTKSLGQLAANYNSLQAISLEGNPAQKNIGDENLKKYLVGLLPHLTYFNRQSIKAGSIKDSADRAARLGISAHQSDHRGGLRSELKKSTHGRKNQPAATAMVARGRHGRLPPSGVKTMATDRVHVRDVSNKLQSFRPDLAIRRTHSEGLLRAV